MFTEEDVRKTLDRFHKALLENDTDTINEIYADDYRGFNLSGGIDTKSIILEVYKPGVVKLEKLEISDLKIELFGEVAMLTGIGYLCGKAGEINFEHNARFIDIFVCRDSQWKYYFSQMTEIIQ